MANILNVGPIVPVDKGVYSSATTYSILNLVDDGTGQVYLSKKNNNLGNNLTNGEWWGRYTGPQGPQGVKGDTGTINLTGEYGTSENVGLNQKFLTEKMAGFEEVVQTQLITTPPATLNAQVGYYYCIGGNGVVVDTMTIQLPAIADKNKTKNVQFFMTMGSAPEVTFVSAGTERILYQKDFALEAERSYEVNALWNGHAWVITVVEIIVPMNIITYEASAKLTETTTSYLPGLHTNAFSGEITSHSFENGIGTIEFDGDVTSIGGSAFYNCTGLTSITIPDSVTSIGNSAFGGCGFTSITIPNSVTSIGINVFSWCSGLTNIVVDSANTVYDSRDNCNAIINTSTNELITGCKNTVIPNTVTSIGDSAFYGCTGLTNITIPDSVTSIGNLAFSRCSGLTSITSLATTAPTINNYTFHDVKTGGTLTVPRGSTGYDVWMGTGNYYLGKYNWTKVEQ